MYQQLDELETLAERIDYITPIIEKFGLEIYFSEAKFFDSWLAARTEKDVRAVRAMCEFYERRKAMGTIFAQTYFLSLIADAWTRVGNHEEALRAAQEGIAIALRNDERFYLAELYRYQGMALLAGGRQNLEAAEQAFKLANADAKLRSARTYELRSSIQLARMWCDEGRSREADDLLRPLIDDFTEGFHTKDFQEAKSLIQQI